MRDNIIHHQMHTLDSPSVITFSTERPRMLASWSFIAQNAPTESCRCTTRIPWYHQNPAYTHRILFALTACVMQQRDGTKLTRQQLVPHNHVSYCAAYVSCYYHWQNTRSRKVGKITEDGPRSYEIYTVSMMGLWSPKPQSLMVERRIDGRHWTTTPWHKYELPTRLAPGVALIRHAAIITLYTYHLDIPSGHDTYLSMLSLIAHPVPEHKGLPAYLLRSQVTVYYLPPPPQVQGPIVMCWSPHLAPISR